MEICLALGLDVMLGHDSLYVVLTCIKLNSDWLEWRDKACVGEVMDGWMDDVNVGIYR